MPTTIIEFELNEHTFAVLWKYVKSILWFHVQGFLTETEVS
jgi:hypothetical protein